MNDELELIADGLAFPEGPCFDADGSLYLVQCDSGWVSRIEDGRAHDYVHTGSTPNGAVFDEMNVLWVAEAGTNQLLRYDGSDLAEIAGSWGGEPLRKPNDLVFAQDGSIYMTGPGGSGAEDRVGVIYHVSRGGPIEVVADGMAFPNGLALTADASLLYVAETRAHRVLAFEVRADGSLDGPRPFAEMPGGTGGDGMALDVDGNLYVAHYGMGEIAVFDAEGKRIGTLPAGGERPTNVAFGGDDLRDLFVTEVETGAVYRLRPGSEGLRPFCDPRK